MWNRITFSKQLSSRYFSTNRFAKIPERKFLRVKFGWLSTASFKVSSNAPLGKRSIDISSPASQYENQNGDPRLLLVQSYDRPNNVHLRTKMISSVFPLCGNVWEGSLQNWRHLNRSASKSLDSNPSGLYLLYLIFLATFGPTTPPKLSFLFPFSKQKSFTPLPRPR